MNIWEKFPKMIINNTYIKWNQQQSCIVYLYKEIVNLHIPYTWKYWRCFLFGGLAVLDSNGEIKNP